MGVACCKMWSTQAKAKEFKTQLSGCASVARLYWKHHWSAVSVPNVLHQAQPSWRWKQSCRCIHLSCFVYFDNIAFLYWQHSHMSLPINLHLKAGKYRKESSKKKSQPCKLPSWKKEIRSKEGKGSCNSNLRTVRISSKGWSFSWFSFTALTCQYHLKSGSMNRGNCGTVPLRNSAMLIRCGGEHYLWLYLARCSQPAQSTTGTWDGTGPELYSTLYSALKWLMYRNKIVWTIILCVLGPATSFYKSSHLSPSA